MKLPQIYLASKSPRRGQLLQQLGIEFEILETGVDEKILPDENAEDYVQRLALEKALSAWNRKDVDHGIPILGADTCIVLDGEVIGKPANKKQGLEILARLSGRRHKVLTAVAALAQFKGRATLLPSTWNSSLQLKWQQKDSRIEAVVLNTSEVEFREISKAEKEAYWNTQEPVDKAGAYAIQGQAALFIRCIHGSYSGIMGLPLYETGELLSFLGIKLLQTNLKNL